MKEASHIPYTKRQWRIRKRRELQAIRKALHDYSYGSVYCPGYQHYSAIYSHFRDLEDALSTKSWGH